jgi:CheY-like chemotaxis protein
MSLVEQKPMKEFADKTIALIANGDLPNALTHLLNLLTLADSDLKNDAIILRGRLSKLKSDVRKGIVPHSDEMLEFNRVQNATLDLLNDMNAEAAVFTPFLNDVDDSISRHTLLETELAVSAQRKRLAVSEPQKNALFSRIAYVKERAIPFRILWVHDFPTHDISEFRLVNALGVESVYARTSDLAIDFLQKQAFDLIISDIDRDGNRHEGIDFLNRLKELNLLKPLIFYIANYDDTRGTPPKTFGITNRPNELLHLVMDVIERK